MVSGQGQAPESTRHSRPRLAHALHGTAGSAARLLRGLVLATLGTALLLLAMAAGFAWRLSRAPLAVDWLAPRIEAAAEARGVPLGIAGVTLGWAGRDGAPLHLSLAGVRAGPADHPSATIASVQLGFAPAALALGRLVPRALVLDRLRIDLLRTANGLRLADGSPLPALPSPGPQEPGQLPLAGLDHLRLTDAQLVVQDAPSAVTWRASVPRASLDRGTEGLAGEAEATLDAGGLDDSLHLTLHPGAAGESLLQAQLGAFNPAALARAAPGLPAAFTDLDAPLQLSAKAVLDPELTPRNYTGTLTLGAGRATVAGAPLGLAGVLLSAQGTPTRLDLTLEHLAFAAPGGAKAPPPTVQGSASLQRRPDALLADVALRIDHVAFAELADYWPASVAHNAQAWVTRNITAGTAHDGQVAFSLRAAPDGSGLRLVAASGTLLGDDATVSWLKPVPPIEHMQARLVLEGLDALSVTTQGGVQAGWEPGTGEQGGPPRTRRPDSADPPLRLGPGLVRITGLSVKDQAAAVGVDLGGGLAGLVSLLSHPRLHLLARHPPGFTDPHGRFTARLDLAIPLDNHLQVEQIGMHVRSHLTSVHLGAVAAGQSLDRGVLDLEASARGLEVSGTGEMARVPVRLDLAMDFRDGPPSQVVQHATVQGEATAARLGEAGVSLVGVVDGTIGLRCEYNERRSGRAMLDLDADLSAATLTTPLGWSKPEGQAAGAQATLLLDHGHLASVERLRATAPGLLLRGRAETAEGRPTLLRIEAAELGRSRATGTVSFPRHAGPVRAVLTGPLLDLSATFAGQPAPAPPLPAPALPATGAALPRARAAAAAPAREETAWTLDARFARVLLGRGRVLEPVTAYLEDDGREIDAMQLRAGNGSGTLQVTLAATQAAGPQPSPALAPLPPGAATSDALARIAAGPQPAAASIRPGIAPATGIVRHLEVQAADAGALLSAFNVTNVIRGGRLTLGGSLQVDAPGQPLTATLQMNDFSLMQNATAGRVLQGLTLYGLADLLDGPGLHFDRLNLPFRMADRLIQVDGARAYSASLGLTASGRIDLAGHAIDARGTVVPAWFFNQLPGRLPVVGRLFSPEPGGGVFAATYTVTGPLDAPKVSVNPLAALAPGAFRQLLGLP